jgi:response regulator RpfG family c-di-GMP phosphodiesterase
MSAALSKVLIVDDEPFVLDAIQRQHGRRYALEAARGAAAALELVRTKGPFAVVVSDYNMPQMDGVTFLARMHEVAPQTMRVLLTGRADMRLAVEAVNRGAIFRFATKPCATEEFVAMVDAAVEQHRLLVAEHDLLEQTLAGSVRVLADVLGLVSPDAFGRAARARELVKAVAAKLCPTNAWEVETAALLSQVGLVAVPSDVLSTFLRNGTLSPSERAVVERAPEVAATLLEQVPRMGAVAQIVRHQRRRFDESAPGKEVPLGARILSAALAYDELLHRGANEKAAIAELRDRRGCHDPLVLDALAGLPARGAGAQRVTLAVCQLVVEMVLDQDVLHREGAVLVPRGQEVTPAILARLRSHAELGMVQEPIRVLLHRDPSRAPAATPVAPAST